MTYIIMMFFFFKFQVIEFVQFKERLQHSNQYLVARVEGPILQLKQNADNIEEEEVLYVVYFAVNASTLIGQITVYIILFLF